MTLISRLRREETGSTSVFAICVAAVLMLLAGLCVDGGRVLNARATLTDTAEQAARAGAQKVQLGGLRQSGAARAAATTYLASTGSAGAASASVTTTGDTVTVTAEEDVPTFMLSLVGMSTVHITVTGSAEAESGIN